MSELKRCPFCGNKGYSTRVSNNYDSCTPFLVTCNLCGVKTKRYKTPEESEKAWNKRKENG